MFSVIKVGYIKEQNHTPQFIQLNLLTMPSLENHIGKFNFELNVKKLNKDQIQVSLR